MKQNKKNRNKNLVLLFFIIIPVITMAQQKKYTVHQMKDTIAKYDDIFMVYNKLDSGRTSKNGYTLIYGYPSYDSIRNDVELKKSLLGLLDIKAYRNHRIKEFENKLKKDISKNGFDSLQFTRIYLKRYVCKECSSKTLKKLTDSIESSRTIFKTYFDSAVVNRLKIEEEDIMNSNMSSEKRNIVDFLYPTQWHEVREFVKENWDDRNPVSYKNKILIEMNDRETERIFEKYFTEILYAGKLEYYDYLFARKFYYNKDFKIKLFLKILQCPITYYVDFFDNAEITTIKNDEYIPLKEDVFDELISYPLKIDDFETKGKRDYNKVIQYFR